MRTAGWLASPGVQRAAGIGLGLAADSVLADPPRWHPVAGVGQLASHLESALYQPRRVRGGVHLALVTLPLTAAAAIVQRRLARPGARLALLAAISWAAIGSRSLRREAERLHERLASGDLTGARALMPNLVGRDPTLLDGTGMARAAIESVAENTSDAVVGPLLWGALTGAPGVVGYRILNTLDAMVGHHSERYERFGYVAARLDDLAGLLPARLTAVLTVLLARSVDGSGGEAQRAWRRDASAHPSPNAGPCEAAFAGALGVRLGGPTIYPYGLSSRPWQGDGRDPVAGDVLRAARLSRDVSVAAAIVCAAMALALDALAGRAS
ncbi:MAG TPA: cobalamin biosynthesis protein [Frankiaceae bacterium]|jgi:adenosylcobinamide-phosphate synthase|nr:cobalamin biosynthesis protein [Frankiaceae bacterium]